MSPSTDAFVFMKVGRHAGEELSAILERKNLEYKKTGRIFWGYGGGTCHPTKQVQPFVQSRIAAGEKGVFLLMEPINSLADPAIKPATEYSVDGATWLPIPKGIRVTGSKFALVLDEIMPTSMDLDPREYVVGIGDSAGKHAVDYLKGRVDKGCFQRSQTLAPTPIFKRHSIGFAAKLQEPYAVFVRE